MKPSKSTTGSISTSFSSFTFFDLETIEDCGDGDPNGVFGKVEARANPVHNKRQDTLMSTSESQWTGLLSRTWKVYEPSSEPKQNTVSTGTSRIKCSGCNVPGEE